MGVGVQGHSWTETWAACRSASALSSECEERERERERDVASYLSSKRNEKRRGEIEGGDGDKERGDLRRQDVYISVF